jgi:bifunctional non-homologous end joining protein LigD
MANFLDTNRAKRDFTKTAESSGKAKALAAKASPPRPGHGKPAAHMPEFVEPQLTRLVDRPPAAAGWVHEIKFDGYRMQLRIEAGRVTLRSRKGLDWTERFSEIAKAAAVLPDCMLDGEIVALDSEGRPDFAGLQAALSSDKTGGLVFFLFDALFAQGEDLRALPLRDRKTRLQALLGGVKASKVLRFVEHFETAGSAVLESACRMDLEGVVSKRLDAPYRSGRSDDWTKAKCRGGQEVILAGWTTTGGKAFRSLIAGVMRDGKLVHVGRIGTGFSRDKVEALLPKLEKIETKTSPFTGPGAPRTTADTHWVKPVLVAEIGFAGWTGDGHIRQASFKALREDKPAREVQVEDTAPVKTVENKAAKPAAKAKAPAKASDKPVVRGITISHPDKVLWPAHAPEPAVTKLEHVQYLEAVSGWMLPYIQGRPSSIIRTPEGIDGERFFQRHAGLGTSSLITLTKVTGDAKPYLQFDTVEAIIAAAQSGATEIHPWQSLPGNPELPGRFVFDLDPDEDLPFERVIEAAKEVRERLTAVGLESLLKTTGGKGLHVVSVFTQPKGKPIEWPQAKAFAQKLCAQMAADSPDRYVINMAKKVRTGRIFLDYLRNDRTSSAVALLSARSRPGAPVSMPLSWSQAKKGLDPKAYTVRTAPALMKKRDPWAGWEETARPLKDAIAKLDKAG